MPSAAVHSLSSISPGLCKRGNFALLSVLPAVFERQGAGEGAWGREEEVLQEERKRTRQGDMRREGERDDEEKGMMRYGMMKGKRIS